MMRREFDNAVSNLTLGQLMQISETLEYLSENHQELMFNLDGTINFKAIMKCIKDAYSTNPPFCDEILCNQLIFVSQLGNEVTNELNHV
jgi:hypothetical protein